MAEWEVGSEPAGLLAAYKLVEWGARVFPAFVSKTGEKVPLIKDWPNAAVGLGVENGLRNRTLEEWYGRYPWAWVGIACGVDSFLCLDVDGRAGVDRLRELISSGGLWESGALVARTPGRDSGLHVYWKWPGWMDRDFHSAKLLVDGGEIELRGGRCFVLAVGAKRPDGVYEILEEPGAEGPIEAPRGLVDLLLGLASESVAGGGVYGGSGLEEVSPAEAWDLAPLVEGRKNCLAGLAWHLAIRGGGLDEVLECCLRFSTEVCTPPLNEDLVRRKVEYTVGRAARRREEGAKEIERYTRSLKDIQSRSY